MKRVRLLEIRETLLLCIWALVLAGGMALFAGKTEAVWETYPAFVTFNEFPGGAFISGNKIYDDDMDAHASGLTRGDVNFTSGYKDGTYPYDSDFEVTAWIRDVPVKGKKPMDSPFWVFIANRVGLNPNISPSWEDYRANHRTVVLDFTSLADVLAPADNVYSGAVQYWTAIQVSFAMHSKLTSLLRMEPGNTLSGTDGIWFGFVVPGLTAESIGETRELEPDSIYGQLIVFWMRFDSEIIASYDENTPPNPVGVNLANKWVITNTSSITLEIKEKVRKGKKEEWRQIPLARYNMPFQITMVFSPDSSAAPKKHNNLAITWGGIKR
jgi:hypothetical protein